MNKEKFFTDGINQSFVKNIIMHMTNKGIKIKIQEKAKYCSIFKMTKTSKTKQQTLTKPRLEKTGNIAIPNMWGIENGINI